MLGEIEHDQRQSWNATRRPYPHDRCVHELVAEQAALTPTAVAVAYEDERLSYRELDARANQLAQYLRARGVGPETIVGLCLPRSLDLVVGLLGILKAGAAYLPIDPGYPGERIAFMLDDASTPVLVTSAAIAHPLGEHLPDRVAVLRMDVDGAVLDRQPTVAPETGVTPDNLAYFIYTSGSTGKPKGVMNIHRALVNRLDWMQDAYRLGADDRVLQKTPYTFDVSVWEFLWPLMVGARLILARPEGHKDPFYLIDLIRAAAITTVHFVPSMLELFLAVPGVGTCHSLKRVICSGEALANALRIRFFETLGAELHNLYGPTEAAIDVTYWACSAQDDRGYVPIGRPIANVRTYVLDERLRETPVDTVGELYLGGVGLARGYLGRTGLTATRFIADPFGVGERLYRTGDVACWRSDGTLQYLGRADDQVKIHGVRIELGEIESVLREHPQVRECVVLAREDVPGDKVLVAFAVPVRDAAATAAVVTGRQLRDELRCRLPGYMVPATVVLLESLPLTANGKLDRKQLMAMPWDRSSRPHLAPATPSERTLAAIWGDVLRLDRIGLDDDFFELGGHSLQAVRLLSRLQSTFKVPLSLSGLFARPTLGAMAATIDRSTAKALPPIVRIPRDGPLSLSFAQQRLWFLTRMEGVSEAYHMSFGARLSGPLDRSALRRALDGLLARHEVLRTVFESGDGQPRLRVLPAAAFALREQDAVPSEDVVEWLRCAAAEEAGAPFDLAHGPLIRGRLLTLRPDEHVLLLTQHHIVSDGWSIAVLMEELGQLYGAFAVGGDDPLPAQTIQYLDFAAWQRQWLVGEPLQEQADYWRKQLADAPVWLELPTDRPRPPQPSFAGASLPVRLDTELTDALRRMGQRHGVTSFMIVLSAWAIVLSRLSRQDDVVIGVPTASRTRQELESLIGFFVNTLAVRVDLTEEPSVTQLLARVREVSLAAQDHQDLPFEQVVEIVQPLRRADRTPLFQVALAWQNNEPPTLTLPGVHVRPLEAPQESAKFDLTLELSEHGDGIAGMLTYATELFDAATIERHRGYLMTVLRAMVADATQPVATIPLLGAAELDRVLREWNRTAADYPAEQGVHALFAAQARRTPHAIAITQDDTQLTYAELDQAAERLGERLRRGGVGPETRVAVCAERRPYLIVGLLAVLKAGGAYLPLDPVYPAERLRELLVDAQPVMLLTDRAGRQAWQACDDAVPSIATLALDDMDTDEANVAEAAVTTDAVTTDAVATRLAYVIYTSGSTGKPKGVMVEHAQLTNLVTWHIRRFGLDGDTRTALTAGIGFDASVWETWPTLCAGGELLLPPASVAGDPAALLGWWRQATFEVGFLVTPLLEIALDRWLPDRALRYLLTGGERLRPCPSLPANVTLVNQYGPTETTVVATSGPVAAGDAVVSLGRPIANTWIYLLDRHGQPVPQGTVGEIHIGGHGVARGYLHRPALTAERFVEDPFCGEAGRRMYRTGDLARHMPDGALEFMGRIDDQLKIRGFRIEPGEIEARLLEHPGVHEAIVLLREGEGEGERRLVTYFTTRGDVPPDAASLRQHLARQLPDYMVPAAFVRLERLPLNAHGKVDRQRLPVPAADAFVQQDYEAPRGDTEHALATIWSELLRVERIGRHDNFFELGGHSLLANQVMVRLQERFSMELPLRTLFDATTISEIAERIDVVQWTRQRQPAMTHNRERNAL